MIYREIIKYKIPCRLNDKLFISDGVTLKSSNYPHYDKKQNFKTSFTKNFEA
jgi:hypothetical protein